MQLSPCSKERDLLEDLIVSMWFLYLQLLEFFEAKKRKCMELQMCGT